MNDRDQGWKQVQALLPSGWERKARVFRAFRRSRFLKQPSILLRVLLFHALSGTGLRLTVRQLQQAGIAHLSAQSLAERLRFVGPWLTWIAAKLCDSIRDELPPLPVGLRLRVVDGSSIQRVGTHQLDWRLHYTIDLLTMACDWCRVTEHQQGEALWLVPVRRGDVLLADRYYLTTRGADYVRRHGGRLIVRMRWNHPVLVDEHDRRFHALPRAFRLKVGEVGEWKVRLLVRNRQPIEGRVVATRIPASKARNSRQKLMTEARRKHRRINRRSLQAARLVMLLTTVPSALLNARQVLAVYRGRWQVELALKLLKQLLQLGHVPYRRTETARAWLMAKLVVSLLVAKARLQSLASFRCLGAR